MTRKNAKTEPKAVQEAVATEQLADETAANQNAEQASGELDSKPKQAGKTGAKTSAGYVEATLKTRHCSGGRCKEAGETMRMTRGEYERLKKFDRVE